MNETVVSEAGSYVLGVKGRSWEGNIGQMCTLIRDMSVWRTPSQEMIRRKVLTALPRADERFP
jgi:hypothetical protein